MTRDEWVRMGVMGRPHGIQGAVKAHLDDPHSKTLRKGLRVRLSDDDGARGAEEHRVVRYAAGVLSLDDIHDRTAAERLTGKVLSVRRADFPADDAAVYLVDVVGLPARTPAGLELGVIRHFLDNGAQPLAGIETKKGEVLVPFVPPILVEVAADHVVLAPPPGLFDEDAIVVADSGATDASDDEEAQ